MPNCFQRITFKRRCATQITEPPNGLANDPTNFTRVTMSLSPTVYERRMSFQPLAVA